MIRHALEHLELHPGLDVLGLAQHEAVGDVEQVVARDAQVDRRRVLAAAAVLEHAFVVRVHLGLGLVGRLPPAVRRGLDALHDQVRALDDAELDRRAAAGMARERPFREGALDAVRVGKIGLQDDARAQQSKLRFVEHLAERRDGQVQIPILLHV